jgi:3-dehydroquinate dehydratase/shikimate dehydrogenase
VSALHVPCVQLAALECAESCDPVAERIGAANTLVRQPDGSLRAYNTDWSAAISAVEDALGGDKSPLWFGVFRRRLVSSHVGRGGRAGR